MTEESTLLGTAEDNTDTADDQQKNNAESQENTEDKGEKKDGENEKEGAPEKYEDFTLPDGFEMPAEALEAFTPIAQDLGLSQESAQKFVDLYATMQTTQIEQAAEQMAREHETWVKELKNDKEFGGDNFQANVVTARKAVQQFGTDELRGLLDETGLGSHPEFVRFCQRIGKSLSEDTQRAGAGAPGEKSTKERLASMYPNTPKDLVK